MKQGLRKKTCILNSCVVFRFLDEFGDGFGMAQAISYVDHSQLLTYMALEERLAQAMEVSDCQLCLLHKLGLQHLRRSLREK